MSPKPHNGDFYTGTSLGRRVKKTVYAYGAGAWDTGTTTLYVYDGWNLIREMDGAGVAQKDYVWGPDLSQSLQGAGGVGGLIAAVDGGTQYIYFYDGNGNVGQVVDSADGSMDARYEYDPFGKTQVADGVYADENVFRFSTKFFDGVSGLYYYGYRYYSTELGRWISRDPIGEDGGLNLLCFALNDGVNTLDLLGLYRPFQSATNFRLPGTDRNPLHEDAEGLEDAIKYGIPAMSRCLRDCLGDVLISEIVGKGTFGLVPGDLKLLQYVSGASDEGFDSSFLDQLAFGTEQVKNGSTIYENTFDENSIDNDYKRKKRMANPQYAQRTEKQNRKYSKRLLAAAKDKRKLEFAKRFLKESKCPANIASYLDLQDDIKACFCLCQTPPEVYDKRYRDFKKFHNDLLKTLN